MLPLKLWNNSSFTLSNVANMAVVMSMFGAIFFISIYAQGVIGVSVANSDAALIPLTASMILVSVLVGRLTSSTQTDLTLAPDEPDGSSTPHERAQLYARQVARPLAFR